MTTRTAGMARKRHDDDKRIPSGKDSSANLSQQTFSLLGITVLVTQLPLLFHLPLLLTLPGMLLALVTLLPQLRAKLTILPALMTPLVLLSALAVILYYGNFFSRDPCVVFLFLLINFKFIETKRINDASLIIVLCAFLLLTQFFYWQTIAAAVLAIPSMFLIGLSLFSLQRGANSMSLRDMTNVTARLFLQAIPIAAVLFVTVPRLPASGYGAHGGDGSAVTGLSSSMAPGTVASLARSNAVAFRVDFDGQPPSAAQRYWRGPVLSGFDGYEWFINDTVAQFEIPDTRDKTPASISYTVTVEPTSNPWLLALDTPTALPVSGSGRGRPRVVGHINHERQINATRQHAGAYRYRMTSRLTDRFKPLTVPGAEMMFTGNSNPQTRQYAAQLRERYPDDRQLINQVLLWFNREPFHYTLQPQQLGVNGIDEFLFSTRRGFCEHYAGSFVFMLRAAGIPARVVTGYQGGEMNGDYMIVRQSDAHAWAEAYVDGQWQRYDPTASVALERVETGLDAALGDEMNGLRDQLSRLPLVRSLTLQWDAINYKWQSWVIEFDSRRQQSLWQTLGLHKPSGWHIAIMLVLVGALWTLIIVLPGSIIRQRNLDPCEKQWRRLLARLAGRGMAKQHQETPTQYIGRVSQRWPEHANTLQLLLEAYHSGRFSSASQKRKDQDQYARQMHRQLAKIGRLTT